MGFPLGALVSTRPNIGSIHPFVFLYPLFLFRFAGEQVAIFSDKDGVHPGQAASSLQDDNRSHSHVGTIYSYQLT